MSQPQFKIFRPEIMDHQSEVGFESELTRDLGEGMEGELASLILEGVTDPVRISAGDLFSLLQDALSSRRAWLQDFADDSVVVSKDFYEVLLAYQRMVQKKAA